MKPPWALEAPRGPEIYLPEVCLDLCASSPVPSFCAVLPPALRGCCGWVASVPWPGEELSPQCHPSRQLHTGALARLPSERTVPPDLPPSGRPGLQPRDSNHCYKTSKSSRCTGPGGRRFPCMGVQLPRFPGTVSGPAGASHTAKLPPSGGGRGCTWAAFPLRSGHPCSHSQTGQLCPSRGSCLGAVLVVMLGA